MLDISTLLFNKFCWIFSLSFYFYLFYTSTPDRQTELMNRKTFSLQTSSYLTDRSATQSSSEESNKDQGL